MTQKSARTPLQRVYKSVTMVTARMSALQVILEIQDVTTEATAGDYGY